jgi:hypothetical protein
MASFESLADDIAAIEVRVSEAIFDAVRSQLRGGDEAAKEVEKRLAKVRRSLQKAEFLLRRQEPD